MIVAKVTRRNGLDLVSRDRAQAADQLFTRIQGQILHPVATQFARLVENRVELVDLTGYPLRLDTVQFSLGHAVPGNACHLITQSLLHLRCGFTRRWHPFEHEQLGSTTHQAVVGARAVGHTIITLHQRTLKSRAAIAIQNSSQNGQ